MAATATPPQDPAVDAGVIDAARARQRRQRGQAAAVTAAAAIAAITLAVVGGGGRGSDVRAATQSSGSVRWAARTVTLSACLTHRGSVPLLQGAPDQALLSILGVLRRPATPADELPSSTHFLDGGFLGEQVFVRYIRRARTAFGETWYVIPARFTSCAIGGPHEGIMLFGFGASGGGGGGGQSAAVIEQHGMWGSTSGGTGNPAGITYFHGVIPDGVATVTFHYPAGKVGGFSRRTGGPVTVDARVINNVVVVAVPRAGEQATGSVTVTWRAADGHVVKTFNGL